MLKATESIFFYFGTHFLLSTVIKIWRTLPSGSVKICHVHLYNHRWSGRPDPMQATPL